MAREALYVCGLRLLCPVAVDRHEFLVAGLLGLGPERHDASVCYFGVRSLHPEALGSFLDISPPKEPLWCIPRWRVLHEWQGKEAFACQDNVDRGIELLYELYEAGTVSSPEGQKGGARGNDYPILS